MATQCSEGELTFHGLDSREVVGLSDGGEITPVAFAGRAPVVRHGAPGRETTGRLIRIEGDGGMRVPRRGGQPFASDA